MGVRISGKELVHPCGELGFGVSCSGIQAAGRGAGLCLL